MIKVYRDLGLKRENLVEKKAIEVGNIFSLGTKFSEPLGLTYKDEAGNAVPVIMGCYGIGPARVMGTIAEVLSDEAGLIWPESVAPFRVHLLSLGADEKAEEIYDVLTRPASRHSMMIGICGPERSSRKRPPWYAVSGGDWGTGRSIRQSRGEKAHRKRSD